MREDSCSNSEKHLKSDFLESPKIHRILHVYHLFETAQEEVEDIQIQNPNWAPWQVVGLKSTEQKEVSSMLSFKQPSDGETEDTAQEEYQITAYFKWSKVIRCILTTSLLHVRS